MKNTLLACLILSLTSSGFANEILAKKVLCLAKINSKSLPLSYDTKKQSLTVSADGLNAEVVIFNIGTTLSASTTVDAVASSAMVTTGYMRIPSLAESNKENGQPSMMAVADFDKAGKISVFCVLN